MPRERVTAFTYPPSGAHGRGVADVATASKGDKQTCTHHRAAVTSATSASISERGPRERRAAMVSVKAPVMNCLRVWGLDANPPLAKLGGARVG